MVSCVLSTVVVDDLPVSSSPLHSTTVSTWYENSVSSPANHTKTCKVQTNNLTLQKWWTIFFIIRGQISFLSPLSFLPREDTIVYSSVGVCHSVHAHVALVWSHSTYSHYRYVHLRRVNCLLVIWISNYNSLVQRSVIVMNKHVKASVGSHTWQQSWQFSWFVTGIRV